MNGSGQTAIWFAKVLCIIFQALCLYSVGHAQISLPEAVKVQSDQGMVTIYKQPDLSSDPLTMAINGDVFEVMDASGDFLKIRLSEDSSGFILASSTAPTELPKPKSGISAGLLVVIAVLLTIAAVGGFLYMRMRREGANEASASAIASSIKNAEEFYRSGDYSEAIRQFNIYLQLQGGEVRNPDVYRRLAACYKNNDQIRESAEAWEKMRSLGGLKTAEDYKLGVDLMIQLGQEGEAAEIYEHLLAKETDEEKIMDLQKTLYGIYRRIKKPDKLIQHAISLMNADPPDKDTLPATIRFLIDEGRVDLAISSDHKPLITNICQEFLEEEAITSAAETIYLKCLEYDRKSVRLHRMLAKKYKEDGDFRKGVSELSILAQLDKDKADEYYEKAARIYVDSSHVQDALMEGNPKIVKKIAQIFLANSEVNPDAVATYEKVLELQPRAIGVNKMLATVYLTRGELHKYMDKLRLLHEIDGANHDYLSDLAQCVIDNDLIEQTLKEGNKELVSKILKQLFKRGATDDRAVKLFERLVSFEPNNVQFRTALARAYEKRGEPAKHVEQLVALSRLQSNDRALAARAADLAVKADALEPVLASGSGTIIVRAALGLVEAQGKGELCMQVLEKALRASPQLTKVRDYHTKLKRTTQAKTTRQTPQPKPAEHSQKIKAQSSAAPQTRPEGKAQRPEPSPADPTASRQAARTQRLRPQTQARTTQRVKDSDRTVRMEPQQGAPTARQGAEQETRARVTQRIRTTDSGARQRPGAKTTQQVDRAKKTGRTTVPIKPKPDNLSGDSSLAKPEPRRKPPSAQGYDATIRIETDHSQPQLTTFVSAASQEPAVQYREEELFRPETGGLAYKALETLRSDGWGQWLLGVEVNTARKVLLRTYNPRLLDRDRMAKFINQLVEVGFSMTHESILPYQEMVKGPKMTPASVHPALPLTLDEVMKRDTPPTVNVRISIVRRIAEALCYAHNYVGVDGKHRRTFHMQLSPGNILLTPDLSDCRVAGCGLAQAYRDLILAREPRWKDPGSDHAYMPPEFFRLRASAISEVAAEVYSFGAVAHLALTGSPPFNGPSMEDYKFQHTKVPAAPPRLTEPSLPDWIDEFVLCCLEKDPTQRWDSMSDVVKQLSR